VKGAVDNAQFKGKELGQFYKNVFEGFTLEKQKCLILSENTFPSK